jgi:F5/8 type C domain.
MRGPCEASALDPSESVALTVDFGTPKKIQNVFIQWEYPAKSFTVSLTADGVKWQEVFATDSNVLGITNVPIGFMKATKARVVMQEACPSDVGNDLGICFDEIGARDQRHDPRPCRLWHQKISRVLASFA